MGSDFTTVSLYFQISNWIVINLFSCIVVRVFVWQFLFFYAKLTNISILGSTENGIGLRGISMTSFCLNSCRRHAGDSLHNFKLKFVCKLLCVELWTVCEQISA